VAVARALAVEPTCCYSTNPPARLTAQRTDVVPRLAEERARRPLAVCLASHQLEDAYRGDDVRRLAEGRLSPVTPRTCPRGAARERKRR